MLLQDVAIVVLLVAPGLAAVYWLRRSGLFARLKIPAPRLRASRTGRVEVPLARRRASLAETQAIVDKPQEVDEIALGAERARGLHATAEKQLDAAQYALKRLVLDLQGVMPALQPDPPVVVHLPDPQQRPPRDRARAA
jgi:hypothetical protein